MFHCTFLPSIFITGVHPPSPHPKYPMWQKTEICFESMWSVTSWLTRHLLNIKIPVNRRWLEWFRIAKLLTLSRCAIAKRQIFLSVVEDRMVQNQIFDPARYELTTFELTRRCHIDWATGPDESRLLVMQAGDLFTRIDDIVWIRVLSSPELTANRWI